jgi:hypothetical protein
MLITFNFWPLGGDQTQQRDTYTGNISSASKNSHCSDNISNKSENHDPLVKTQQLQLMKLQPNSRQSEDIQLKEDKRSFGPLKDSGGNPEHEMFKAVDANEIRRQKNSEALRRHLREISSDWDNEVNDLNTLRRTKVLKELHNYLKNTIDLVKVRPEEIGIQVEVALQQALDAHFETINLGQMYVPMEETPSNPKAVVTRENADYDTFGSIDSLIFEPKVPSQEDIKEVQEEIEQQFEYLDHIGVDESGYNEVGSAKKSDNIEGAGKTTFAQKVNLFQRLGKKEIEVEAKQALIPVQWAPKKITMHKVFGRDTTWCEVAKSTDSKELGSEALRVIKSRFGARSAEKLERKEESASEDDFSSVCPECQYQAGDESLGTLGCSICNCCTLCDAEEEEERMQRDNLYHTTVASWDFEKPALPVKQADKLRQKSAGNSAKIAKSEVHVVDPVPVVGNLRQKLREAFRSSVSSHLTDLIAVHSSDKQSFYEPLNYGSSSVERDVDHQVTT